MNKTLSPYPQHVGLKLRLMIVIPLFLALIVSSSCKSSLKVSDACTLDQGQIFTGKKWKLRLLTSLYKPYRAYKPFVKESITAFKIEYPSRVNGKEIILSGVLIIPNNQKEPLPLLMYCHGTFFSKRDAPSNWQSSVQIQALPAMAGYITFIPDYLGYGSSKNEVPAYFDQELSTRGVLDMLDSGISYLKDCGISYKKELFILGYSQGGHTAVSLLKSISSDSASHHNLNIKATVSIAAPFKLNENVKYILDKDSFPITAYVSYLFMSLNQRHWYREMSDFFRDSSLFYIEEHLKGKLSLNRMALNQSDIISELMQKKFLENYLGDGELEVKRSLEKNSNFNFVPNTPLLIIHSKSDEVVPYQTSRDCWNNWINEGANSKEVKFHSLEDANHSESAFQGIVVGLNFLDNFH